MQKIVLALLVPYMAVTSNLALADWVRVNGNDKVTAYADTSNIRKKGNLVKIWSLFDFKAENTLSDGSSYQSVMRETEFNCKDHVQHMLSYSIHSGNMAKGRVVDRGGEPQDWKPVTQSGIATAMMAFACSKD